MHYQTVILTSDNWAVGTHDNPDILNWAIRDMPWLILRTLNFNQKVNVPSQIKSNSWTDAQVNNSSIPSNDIKILTSKISVRIKLLSELVMRLRSHTEMMGISDTSSILIKLHEYLVANNIIEGTSEIDAKIKYENSIRLLQDLEKIKQTSIEKILQVNDSETFEEARSHMNRMFFTNILL